MKATIPIANNITGETVYVPDDMSYLTVSLTRQQFDQVCLSLMHSVETKADFLSDSGDFRAAKNALDALLVAERTHKGRVIGDTSDKRTRRDRQAKQLLEDAGLAPRRRRRKRKTTKTATITVTHTQEESEVA